MTDVIGWIGLTMLLIAWIPQTVDTVRAGRAPVNLLFILLYVFSSASLALYAFLKRDYVFLTLNALLTLGSGINLYYKLKPRNEENSTGHTESA